LPALTGAYVALLVIDDPPLDTRAAGVAMALVVVGELVGWTRELIGATRDEPGNAWRRPAWIAGVGMGALGLAWGVLAVADLARVQGSRSRPSARWRRSPRFSSCVVERPAPRPERSRRQPGRAAAASRRPGAASATA
jgi:hypothetical protein